MSGLKRMLDKLRDSFPPRDGTRRWRHVKRGTTYTEIGRGKMQSTPAVFDMWPVVIYKSDSDGSLWVRPVTEFEDGRFTEI